MILSFASSFFREKMSAKSSVWLNKFSGSILFGNESERAVQNSLEKLMKNRTTLVIAHGLSTIRNAKRIFVLTDNGIEEQGTHEELIALDSTYANLYNM
jgi:ABC-type transport system involved in Fe-S cluster assembly fused permease/ATPase subunit